MCNAAKILKPQYRPNVDFAHKFVLLIFITKKASSRKNVASAGKLFLLAIRINNFAPHAVPQNSNTKIIEKPVFALFVEKLLKYQRAQPIFVALIVVATNTAGNSENQAVNQICYRRPARSVEQIRGQLAAV